jgi:hypothetical protein
MFTLKKLINVFINVIAGNTCGAAIYITIFYPEVSLSYMLLWQIIGLAAICALGILIFTSRREMGKREIKIRFLFHYIYINVVVISWAILCEWIQSITVVGVVVLMLIIAGVYTFVSMYSIKSDERVALELNKRLRKVNKEEE